MVTFESPSKKQNSNNGGRLHILRGREQYSHRSGYGNAELAFIGISATRTGAGSSARHQALRH